MLNNLAVAYVKLNRLREAIDLLQRALAGGRVRNVTPHDNLRKIKMALEDSTYHPDITYVALIRP